jgi:hypothetical protein
MAFSVDDIASAVRAYISMSAAAARVSATQTSALRCDGRATAVASERCVERFMEHNVQ